VAAYRTLDEAEILKKKSRPRMFRSPSTGAAADKKLIFAVKAGSLHKQENRRDMASRLKNDIHLARPRNWLN